MRLVQLPVTMPMPAIAVRSVTAFRSLDGIRSWLGS